MAGTIAIYDEAFKQATRSLSGFEAFYGKSWQSLRQEGLLSGSADAFLSEALAAQEGMASSISSRMRAVEQELPGAISRRDGYHREHGWHLPQVIR